MYVSTVNGLRVLCSNLSCKRRLVDLTYNAGRCNRHPVSALSITSRNHAAILALLFNEKNIIGAVKTAAFKTQLKAPGNEKERKREGRHFEEAGVCVCVRLGVKFIYPVFHSNGHSRSVGSEFETAANPCQDLQIKKKNLTCGDSPPESKPLTGKWRCLLERV